MVKSTISLLERNKSRTMKKSTAGKPRVTYTEDQRILACTILLENGGYTQLGLQLVREYLGSNVSTDTLHQWMRKYKDKVKRATDRLEAHRVEIIANNNDISAVEVMEDIRNKLLSQLQEFVNTTHDAVDKSSLKNVTLTIAILQDKIEKAIGMSAQMQAAVRPLAIWCSENNLDVYMVIPAMLAALQQQPDEVLDKFRIQGRLGG